MRPAASNTLSADRTDRAFDLPSAFTARLTWVVLESGAPAKMRMTAASTAGERLTRRLRLEHRPHACGTSRAPSFVLFVGQLGVLG
jgi:hypothetical protein